MSEHAVVNLGSKRAARSQPVCFGEGERQVTLPVTAVKPVDGVIPVKECPVRLKHRPSAPRYGAHNVKSNDEQGITASSIHAT
jgi:hypothetical protein